MAGENLGLCSVCYFMVPTVGKPGAPVEISKDGPIGTCHATPPLVICFPNRQGQPIAQSIFPSVVANEWCGSFRSREEATS